MVKRGFTLIELIIVTAIIGMLSCYSVRALINYQHQRDLVTTAQHIVSDLYYLRMMASSTNQDLSLNFTATGYDLCSGYSLNSLRVRPHQYYAKYISGSTTRLGFKPNGTPKYAGSVIINNSSNKSIKITLAAVTGKVTQKLAI